MKVFYTIVILFLSINCSDTTSKKIIIPEDQYSFVEKWQQIRDNYESASKDSFYDLLLDGPHYTRPRDYKGESVPDVLLSGNHKKIEEWFLKKRENKTKNRRFDLWEKYRSIKNDGVKNG